MENSQPERDDMDTSTGADPVEESVGHPVEETEEYARAVDDDSVLPELSVDPPPGPGPQRASG